MKATLWSDAWGYSSRSDVLSHTVDGGATAYTYDDEGQLLSETRTGCATSYTYDGNGNRKTRVVNGSTETYTYDVGDKLTSIAYSGGGSRGFTYDLAGRMLTDTLNSRAFSWTADSRLASLTATTGNESYTYSAFGTRAKVGTRTFLRAGAGVTASVLDDGNAKYTPGISEVRSGSTTCSHSGLKHMGAQSTSAGSIAATNTYDAFGGVAASTGSWQGPFGAAGGYGYQTESSGLHLLGHRYYDASLGRFLTRDPIGDGSSWYAYCENDPSGLADPSGLRASVFGCPAGDFLAGFADRLTETPLPGGLPFAPQPKPLFTTRNLRAWLGQDHLVELDGGHYGGGGVAADTWFFLAGSKAALPKVARISLFDDAANGAKAIIGESMRGRVLPAAQLMPWLDTFSPTVRSRIGGFGQNMSWVLKHCLRGHDFVDIGIDVSRSSRSWWYRAERAVIWMFE